MKGHTTIYDDTLALARKHAKAGNPTEAARLYERVLKAAPQHKKAKKELNALKKVSQGQNQSASAQQQLAELMSLHAEGKFDQAATAAKRLCRLYPDQPMPFNVIGSIQAQRGLFKEAVKSYKEALAIEPNYPDAQNNLGIAFSSLGQFQNAIPCFRRAMALQPKDPRSHINLANALRAQGDLEPAVQSYERAVELQPLEISTHLELGRTLMDMGKLNQARVSFQNCLDINPKISDAHVLKGDVFAKMGMLERAVSCYRNALAIDASSALVHRKLGIHLLQLGAESDAIEMLNKCLALDPRDAEAQHFLAAARGDVITATPYAFIENLFDTYAERFDNDLVDKLGYQVPNYLRAMLDNSTKQQSRFAAAADLGCGTGLSGLAFREVTDTLVGIDLSGEMIAKARERGIYDRLYKESVITALGKFERQFDLFICADTLVYSGELGEFFNAVAQSAKKHALFALSTEDSETSDIELRTSGRYAHSREYIERTASAAGFELIEVERCDVRKELDAWITGSCYLLRYER